MKKILAFALVLVFCGALLCACAPADEGSKVKIGIAAPNVTHGWIAGVAYYAEKYCRDRHITYNITTSADAAEMMANLNELVAWGADAIVIWPQWSGMEDAVAEIIEGGTPVVSFDFDINCEGIYKVTGNNYDMGFRSAEYILSRVGSAATICVLDVPSAGSVASLRKQGFYDYLASVNYDTSNIFEIAETGFSRECGLADMEAVLQSHGHIDAVFSMDDENSIGAVQAITDAGRTDIVAITGGGGMQQYFQMIDNPQYASLGLASALYSPSMVEEAIRSAIALVQGESFEPVIIIPTTVVTSENVKEYIDPENTVY